MRCTKTGPLTLLLLSLLVPQAAATGPLHKIPLVQLELRSLSGGADAPARTLALIDDRPSRIAFPMEFAGSSAHVSFSGRAEKAGDAGTMRVFLQSAVELPDGRRIESTREAVISERKTLLFEMYREGNHALTLAIIAEVTETWEVVHAPTVGSAVRLDVEVQRIESDKTYRLETNILNTFEGQQVEYTFIAGPDPDDEALTLSLTPIRVVDDIVELEIQVLGRLPDDGEITHVAREEHLVANRGVSSAVTIVLGDPPVGYRFLVTPRF